MKVLFDLNHPSHVHLFRNLFSELSKHNVEVMMTASSKDLTFQLLDKFNIPYVNMGTYGNATLEKAIKLPIMAMRMLRVIHKYKPDLMIGHASTRIAHAGAITGVPSFVHTDTEHAGLTIALFKPFATRIYTPDCFYNDLGSKHIRHPSYKELFYLHPNRFQPDFNLLRKFGFAENEKFFVVRFVSWDAVHDIGKKGFSYEGKINLVKKLLNHGKVILSSEGPMPKELQGLTLSAPIEEMHHFLYYAQMYIGESGTMASEAAVLGVPSFFVNPLRLGYLDDLEKNYNLLYQFKDDTPVLKKVEELLKVENLKESWKPKREKMLADKVDGTSYFTNEILDFLKLN